MCVGVNSECFYLVQNIDRSVYVKNMKHEFAIEVIAGSSHSQASQDVKRVSEPSVMRHGDSDSNQLYKTEVPKATVLNQKCKSSRPFSQSISLSFSVN